MTQESLHARLFGSLLADAGCEPDLSTASADELLPLARNNVVVRRTARLFAGNRSEVSRSLHAAADAEGARVAATLETVERLQDFGRRRGTQVVFPKALQHYPDMGHDIDLWTSEGVAFDEALCREIGAVPAMRGVFDRIAGKRSYVLEGCPAPLEIHHRGAGHLGEQRRYLRLVLERASTRIIEGLSICAPSTEDQLIIQVLQRLFSHFTVRISDVMHAAELLRDERLDWDYVRRTTHETGLQAALWMWLDVVGRLYRGATGRELPAVRASGPSERPKAAFDATLRSGVLRLSVLKLGPTLYGRLFLHAIRRRDWQAAGKIAILPAAFGVAGVNRQVRALSHMPARSR